jgi:uncharacterized protein with HEPN domain
MKRNIAIYITDIIENMELAEGFVIGMSYEDFVNDIKTSHAVTRCIEIMGEAAKHVPESVRKKYPEKVWLVLKEDILGLKPHIQEVIADMSN